MTGIIFICKKNMCKKSNSRTPDIVLSALVQNPCTDDKIVLKVKTEPKLV